MVRQRAGDTIELTTSSDSTRRQSSITDGPRPSLSVNKDDPIIIASRSEDHHLPAIHSTSSLDGVQVIYDT
ncbi:hypothetical protein L210DRAFT_3538866 [Boletus edulis BED1]|uniref:Uncharacterized protein n=1 Tax=Boletus edulis BED1 TaxID=1328754 RepID=A0AAD4BAG7_BOLED|nr:hypothetical protein L210DRAFT_3586996 [Boletus edulis BED1]KAF8441000.1 hypothetical protein L210DRAFT_3538866 [Boletus edulis BED1]